jgi:hypothetical protein
MNTTQQPTARRTTRVHDRGGTQVPTQAAPTVLETADSARGMLASVNPEAQAASASKRTRLIGTYASLDAARAAQRRFDSMSLASELFSGTGQWGLHHAANGPDVQYFLRQGAPINGVKLIEWGDGHQHWETPMLTAFVDGRLDVARALIDRGADVDAPNSIVLPSGGGFAHTTLHMLVTSGKASHATALIAAGADVNRQTTLGWTPLHFAAQNDDVEMVRVLVRAGADPNIVDLDGDSPERLAGLRTSALLR